MRLCFGELSEAETNARRQILEKGRAAWLRLAVGDVAGATHGFRQLDPRIELGVDRQRHAWLSALETSAWPLAELLLAQAPDALQYTLSLGRAPLSLSEALEEVSAAQGVDLSRASVRAGFARGHLLEITLGLPAGSGAEIEEIAAENLVRARLGERVFETWIGAVRVAPKPRGGPLRVLDSHAIAVTRQELGLAELFDTVAAATSGLLSGLPDSTRASRTSKPSSARTRDVDDVDDADIVDDGWVMFEVEPKVGARGVRKDDLILASTCMPELLRCYLDDAPCSSRRFSRRGERFVFLSYADPEHAAERRVARRSELEAALVECLGDAGAVTGVGLGLHTTYIDFALCNLETGLARLIAKMRCLDLPPRTFIQFFDSELSEEWLSISPHSRLTSG